MTIAQAQAPKTGTGATVTWNSACTAGNLIVIHYGSDSTISTPGTWNLAVSAVATAGTYQFWKIAAGGETSLGTGAVATSAWASFEYNDTNGSAWVVDKTASNTAGGATSCATGTTATTTQAEALALGLVNPFITTGGAVTSPSWTNSFTQKAAQFAGGAGNDQNILSSEKVLAAIATQTSTASWTGSQDGSQGTIAVYKQTTVGAPAAAVLAPTGASLSASIPTDLLRDISGKRI